MDAAQNKRKIAIMGGTFDPVHYGHLVAAEAVRWEFDLDRIIFIPAGIPAHKRGAVITDAEHRYQMTLLATGSNPDFEVSRIEIDRKGITYTIDTVKALKAAYGPDCEIHFITGADALLDIHTWYKLDELLQSCRFIAATRPGFDLFSLEQKRAEIKSKYGSEILQITIPSLAISSTDIRDRVRNGKPIKYLLPEPVEEYIRQYGLYKE